MAGMAEVSKSPRRLYSVVRNLEWAFPATFVLGIIAVPLWSADMYAGMTLSLTAVALAFGLLRPRRVEKSLGKWRVWIVSLLAPLAVEILVNSSTAAARNAVLCVFSQRDARRFVNTV